MSARPIVVAVAAAAALAPGVALAHSAVLGTDPADGATLDAPPATLTVRFNEDIRREFAYARLTTTAGAETPVTTRVEGTKLLVTPTTPLAGGGYTLAYRIASSDTHPVSGAVHFTVKGAPASTSPTAVPSTTTSAATRTATASPSPTATSTNPARTTAPEPPSGANGGSSGWLLLTGLGIVAAIGGWALGRVVRRSRAR